MNYKLLCGASFAALALSANGALAQAAAPTTRSDVAEVIVTANKRAQNIQDVPVAVTAVSDAKLKSLNIVAVQDIVGAAPSVTFQESPSPTSSSFNIRGIGTFAFNDALEQSVGVVIDGVPQARLIGSLTDAVDISAIQVLRGPQGTLFGKNATAGAIDIAYHDADIGDTSFTGRLFGGSHSEFRAQGTMNMALSSNAAARVTGWYGSRDGFIKAPLQPHDGNIGDIKRYGGRAKIAVEPTDSWRIDVTGEVSRDKNDGSLQTYRGYLPTARDQLIQGINLAAGIVAGPDNLKSNKDFPENNDVKQQRLVVKSVNDLGDKNTLTAIAGYSHTDFYGIWDSDFTDSRSFSQGSVINNRQNLKQKTLEVRVASKPGTALQYTAGLFYYDFHSITHFDAQNLKTDTPLSQGTSTDILNDIRTKNYAAFADASYDLGKLTLIAGGRLSREKTTGYYNRGVSHQFIQPNILFGPFQIRNEITYHDFSYRFGAQFHVNDDVMLYATASRGYKGPGFNYVFTLNNNLVVNNGIIEPEIGKNYEIGVRSQWFDRQLTVNLTGFYSPFTNFQVTSVIPTTPPTFSTTNAPEVTAKGIELEFNVRPSAIEGLSLDGSVVYNDTKYTDFKTAPCYIGQPVAAAPTQASGVCAPISVGSTLQVQNVTGLRTVGSPKWQVYLTARYETPVSDKLKAFGQVNYTYTGAEQFEVGNPTQTIQKAYSITNLTAGIGTIDDRILVSVYGRNIFDKRYASRISFSNPGLMQTIPYNAIRSFGVSVDFKY